MEDSAIVSVRNRIYGVVAIVREMQVLLQQVTFDVQRSVKHTQDIDRS